VPFQRVSVFKWMKKVAVDLSKVSGKEALTSMLKFFVPPLTREINDDGAPEEVRKRAQKVAELIKGNELGYPGDGLGSTLGFNIVCLFFQGWSAPKLTARQWLPLAGISLSDGEIVMQHGKLTVLFDLNARHSFESRNTWLNVRPRK